ncbi:MAG: thiamine pyrophosphate-dependent dehydrogenase E1 component subunit alpha [Nitrospirae bacterium]|nr:thiamine pyrophosphate-dependent dehydrogenase E1 component subunit alpha [Candidatus Manganitrophaceae bacterium]
MIRYPYTGSGFQRQKEKGIDYDQTFLVSLYRSMLRIRLVELEIERRYHEDEMKTPIHLVIGQEAACVGSTSALKREDLVYSSHRTHGIYLAKGGDLKRMMSEMYCRANGCAGSRGGSMHLIDKSVGMAGTSAIVGGAVPIATGAALAAQLKKQNYVSMVLLGDATTEEGVTSESLNFAVLKKLPVIFFCENNFYSVCSSLETRQPHVEIYKRSAGFGLPSVCVDGNNVLDVYEATREAAERARRGEGPTFIEARTYRWRGHGGAGDDSATGYRDSEEVKVWQKYCPIQIYYEFLSDRGDINGMQREQMESEINQEIQEAFAHAIASPMPKEKDLYTHVYSD